MSSLSVIIVEKTGTLKTLTIKEFKLEELYKKCGFKKGDEFLKRVEWNAKYEGKKYFIEVYAKTDGRANSENKYDFPPPIDETLFFGSCAIVAYNKDLNGSKIYTDLSLPLWKKIYEKLFGGFEDLSATAVDDENEEDELENVPKEKKTKQGYLKDGFVVDNDEHDEEVSLSDKVSDDSDDSDEEEENDCGDIIIEDLGSELSEDSYDYESNE